MGGSKARSVQEKRKKDQEDLRIRCIAFMFLVFEK